MKKKAIIITSVILAVILVGGGIISSATKGNNENNIINEAGNDSEIASVKEENARMDGAEELIKDNDASSDSSKADDEEESKKTDQESKTTDQKPKTSDQESNSSEVNSSHDNASDEDAEYYGNGQSSSGGSTQNNNSNSSNQNSNQNSKKNSKKQSSGEKTPNIPTISFPYTISDTDLVVQQVSAYNGYFIEDASDKEVSNVAAIVLVNNGDDLEFAGIGISQGTRSLAFSASQIPAGATVIIQEQNGASYSSSDPYYSATATTQRVESFEMSEKLVSVEDNKDDTVSVTNISGENLSEVKLYFKNYLEEEGVYVGGITYSITLKDLEPDTITGVSADHYDSQYSKIVEVKVTK